MEILRQHQGPIDAVFVAIGGGGLISGVAAYIKAVRPEIKVIGVQTTDSDAMVRSVQAGKRVQLARRRPVLRRHRRQAGRRGDLPPRARAGRRLRRRRHRRGLRRDQGRVPGHAQHPRAGRRARRRRRSSSTSTTHRLQGPDLRRHHLRRQHELRPPALRRRARRGRRGARGAVRGHDPRGARQLQALLRADRPAQRHRVQLPHLRRRQVAHVFVGLAIIDRDEADKHRAQLRAPRLSRPLDLTDDELAKEHVRHMVGGRSELAHDERLYRFVFPERPGALMRFLSSMHPDWNISLFHYRNQGADYGRILVGIQVPRGDKKAFREFLDSAGLSLRRRDRQPGLPAVPALTCGAPCAERARSPRAATRAPTIAPCRSTAR